MYVIITVCLLLGVLPPRSHLALLYSVPSQDFPTELFLDYNVVTPSSAPGRVPVTAVQNMQPDVCRGRRESELN